MNADILYTRDFRPVTGDELRAVGEKIIASPEFRNSATRAQKAEAPYCPVAVAIMRGNYH